MGLIMSDSESGDIVITFDTLFDILRNEKTKEDIQKLSENFLQDVVNYIAGKQTELNDEKHQQSLFESEDRDKKLHQLNNIKRILKEIYERREKKIINMALNKSRFKGNIIDTSALLEEELIFFEMLSTLFNRERDRILNNVLRARLPNKHEIEIPHIPEQKEEFKSANTIPSETQAVNSNEESQSAVPIAAKLVRFTSPVPEFIGEDMQEYGPFEEEDVSKLPIEIADVLIKKDKAQEIKEN